MPTLPPPSPRNQYSLALLAGLSANLLTGCGYDDGPELAQVIGTITLNDQPAVGAEVTFVSTRPDGSTSHGKTDAAGHYKLKFTRDKWGAMLGDHIVKIESGEKRRSSDEAPKDSADDAGEPAPTPIPRLYGQKSKLTATVKAGSNVIDFPLTGQVANSGKNSTNRGQR
ncbi:MAG: hypothetical protein C0478_14740 [Planctomyces sp.]|jgi:hypothetical protein|nr:hypothetical protein [Planctomyces sp.]